MSAKRKSDRPFHLAVIGNYMPRQCGIATFTTDLCDSLQVQLDEDERVEALAMDDIEGGYAYPERVTFQMRANMQPDYQQAAEYLNVKQFDAVVLQHEYGIYGGTAGAYILGLIKKLRMPVITTLHTVLLKPSKAERAVMKELAGYSDRLVVMSHKAYAILQDVYDIPDDKIVFIPHGIPDVPFVDPSFHKDRFGVEGRKVILSFGLLSPNKGYEVMIEAMPDIVKEHPDAVYMILGATHPAIRRQSGEEYRNSLQQRVTQLGMDDHIIFHNRFVHLQLLCQYLGAADCYVTPYQSPQQITSGTLAYALGCGKAIVSTPYWYAEELLDDGRGILAPFGESKGFADALNELLADDLKRNTMRKKAYQYGRSMTWSQVGQSYIDLSREVIQERIENPKPWHVPQRPIERLELPEFNLRHLSALTDDTGILTYARFATPNREYGYNVECNAQALAVTGTYSRLWQDESMQPAMQRYLAFLSHGLNRKSHWFRNNLTYDHRWQKERANEEAHARAMLGLGLTVKSAPEEAVRNMATSLFIEALPPVRGFKSPKALAYAIIGLHSYLEVYGGDAAARRLRGNLSQKLMALFDKNSEDDWPWCADAVTGHAACIPHALLLAGQWIPDADMFETGMKALRWLLEIQTSDEGHLRPVGNSNWYRRGEECSNFDQLPADVASLTAACAHAYRATQDENWLHETQRCFAWFTGRNDLQAPLYDFKTGGCRDGLQPQGPNDDQGAEATLSWLSALITMFDIVGQDNLVKVAREETPLQTMTEEADDDEQSPVTSAASRN